MSDCYNCSRLQEKYDDLRYYYDRRGDRIEKLETQIGKLENELSSAEYKIRNELEPRIESERRSYDTYVTNGGSDVCFQTGISGNCGYSCSIFGEKQECFENVKTEDQILEIYENYVNDGYILDLIEDYGLQEKAKEIDRKIIREQIEEYNNKIKELEEELLNI